MKTMSWAFSSLYSAVVGGRVVTVACLVPRERAHGAGEKPKQGMQCWQAMMVTVKDSGCGQVAGEERRQTHSPTAYTNT